jgi:DNA-binding NarL/FixJ family response regulator
MSVSRFTPEVRGGLLQRIAAGLSTKDTALAVGVREKTVKGRLTRGRREDSGGHAEFTQAVEEARAAAAADRPEAMDDEELARVVSQMARAGSVQAAKLRWEMLQAEREPEASAEVDELDELRERRAQSEAA